MDRRSLIKLSLWTGATAAVGTPIALQNMKITTEDLRIEDVWLRAYGDGIIFKEDVDDLGWYDITFPGRWGNHEEGQLGINKSEDGTYDISVRVDVTYNLDTYILENNVVQNHRSKTEREYLRPIVDVKGVSRSNLAKTVRSLLGEAKSYVGSDAFYSDRRTLLGQVEEWEEKELARMFSHGASENTSYQADTKVCHYRNIFADCE